MKEFKDFIEFKDWLCSMSRPSIFREKILEFIDDYKEKKVYDIIDEKKGIVELEERSPPDYEIDIIRISFDGYVLKVTEKVIENSFTEIVKPHSKKELPNLLEEWLKDVVFAINNASDFKFYDDFPDYVNSLKLLKRELKRIQSKGSNDNKQIPKKTSRKKHSANYKGKITEECIKKLEELAKEKPNLAIDEFFKAAQSRYESCRTAEKSKDGKTIKEKISRYKLRNDIKEARPDLYYRNITPRK